jgi:hypothetical protein
MSNLRKHKTTPVQVDTQSDSGWEEESEVESVSNYKPCTSSEESDAIQDRSDRFYSNSTHQVEYTDVSDYEEDTTGSESDDRPHSSTLPVRACFPRSI